VSLTAALLGPEENALHDNVADAGRSFGPGGDQIIFVQRGVVELVHGPARGAEDGSTGARVGQRNGNVLIAGLGRSLPWPVVVDIGQGFVMNDYTMGKTLA